MIPLKITAYLQTGRVSTTELFLPLDSILAYVWMTENHPEQMIISTSGYPTDELIDAELPLEKRGSGDDWYWACSFACGTAQSEEISYWHKRFDAKQAEVYVDFGKRRGKVDVKAGNYKNYRMPMVTYLIPKIEWYAVGDKSEIEHMVQKVFYIGKKRAQGLGRVSRWTVEEWVEDLSGLRPLPDEGGDREMTIRPPYWLASQYRLVKITNDRRLICNYEN